MIALNPHLIFACYGPDVGLFTHFRFFFSKKSYIYSEGEVGTIIVLFLF